jgi:hypothetical protein
VVDVPENGELFAVFKCIKLKEIVIPLGNSGNTEIVVWYCLVNVVLLSTIVLVDVFNVTLYVIELFDSIKIGVLVEVEPETSFTMTEY